MFPIGYAGFHSDAPWRQNRRLERDPQPQSEVRAERPVAASSERQSQATFPRVRKPAALIAPSFRAESSMQVRRYMSFAELASQQAAWNCLARGVPFRGWQWLAAWWNHYGQRRELFLLAVRDEQGQLVGAAPLFAETSAMHGRCLRFLGTGEVCSDYLSILSTVEHQDAVVDSLADWLVRANLAPRKSAAEPSDRWDLLVLQGVRDDDPAVARLTDRLNRDGAACYRKHDVNCWRIGLPADWDQYESLLSKSHRKQVRRVLRRLLESGRAEVKTAATPEQLTFGLNVLVELHQKRRNQLLEAGCFASPRFAAFFAEVAVELLRTEQLELHWIELDGRPVAAEFYLLGDKTTYAYQSGVDPDVLELEPGRMITIASLRRAIADGQQVFDFLRGDEPYKAHWRATPQPLAEFRVVANRGVSQMRAGVWLAGDTVKHLLKTGLALAGRRN